MRIAVMARHLDDRGGITVYTRNVVRGLLELDTRHEFLLLLSSPTQRGAFGSHPRLTEDVLPSGNRLWWDQVLVPQALRRRGADLVFNPKLSVPIAAPCPRVLTMHGLEQFAERRLFRPLDRAYFQCAMPVFCRRAGAIITMTETGRRDLQRYLGVGGPKVHVIPESYNETCQPVRDEAARGAVARRYGLPSRFILFVGGITPLKNVPALVQAYALLRARGLRDHELVLAGFKRWSHGHEVPAAADLQGHIHEIGFVADEDLAGLYSLADCFVLPSFYEGFGIPILEAQACGCPVVVARGGAMPEVAGDGALTFDPHRPHELADCLERILTTPALRDRLRDQGQANARRYRWRATAEKTLRVFEQLAASVA